MTSREPVLTVKDLTIGVRGSGATVVDDVSLALRPGEMLGLVGESGSGKTTLALSLLGYTRRGLTRTHGAVRLGDDEPFRMGPAELEALRGAAVSYVPQDPASALNPALTIGSQLRQFLKAHPSAIGEDQSAEAKIAEMLSDVRLGSDPFVSRYPHQLSGGQQQRVLIAMAFACRPKLIVLDEPTTALDVTTQRHVLETIRRLCSTHDVAALYVSHDLTIVRELVHRVGIMYAGTLVELGPAARVFERPRHPYTIALLDAVPSTERSEVLVGIEGQPPPLSQRTPSQCGFADRCRMAEEQCRLSRPDLVEIESGQSVRCFRWPETGQTAGAPRRRTFATRAPVSELLVASGVRASYGGAEVLGGVDFDVGSNRCVALVGESGSGKTTLAKCVIGLHRDWTGEVKLSGQPLARSFRGRDEDTFRRMQYVFQSPYRSLNPKRTIGQILGRSYRHFFSYSSKEIAARVSRTLTDVSLNPELASAYPDELSGGERQRVAIGRALIPEPEVLICDEVTSALDVSVQAVIVELLRRLQEERHLAMLFITHNLALVKSIADEVLVLSKGQVVERGSVLEVLEAPRDPYTVELLRDATTVS